MDEKILWIDTETTGLDSKQNFLLQLAGLIEINGEIIDKIDLFVCPPRNKIIDPQALSINKRSIKEIQSFPDIYHFLFQLETALAIYVDKYDPHDKFVCAGYNINFDIGFLREVFITAGNQYYGSWFFSPSLDVMSVVSLAVIKGLRLKNYKLLTVCQHHNIPMGNAHNAMVDITATHALYYKLIGSIKYGAENNRGNDNQNSRQATKQYRRDMGIQTPAHTLKHRRPRYHGHI